MTQKEQNKQLVKFKKEFISQPEWLRKLVLDYLNGRINLKNMRIELKNHNIDGKSV